MATKYSSAEKCHKQDEKRRIHNKQIKSSVKSAVKKVVVAAQSKDKALTESSLVSMIKQIDTAARKGIISKNAAARKKSRMQKFVNNLTA